MNATKPISTSLKKPYSGSPIKFGLKQFLGGD